MPEVAVVGVGQTKFGTLPGKGYKELFVEAYRDAIDDVDGGMDPGEIREAYLGTLNTGGLQLGNWAPLMIEQANLVGVPARHVENACASSGYAFRDAFMAIKSGLRKVVLAAGVEKMTDLPRKRNRFWLGVSGDVEWERLAGTNFPGIYAMMALRHMYEYGTTKEQITGVGVKNHKYGAMNPKAHFRREITLEKAMKAPMVAYPLNLYDVCPISDGASVAILCNADLAKEFTDTPVYVAGSGAGTDYLAIHDREDYTSIKATRIAAREAYRQAGVGPEDLDFAEVHDCFTIAEIIAYEDLGLCERGEGGSLVEEGVTELDGKLPVNISGGLKAKGHPIGATGVGQIYETTKQLRGEAEKRSRQIDGAEIGLTHNVGGSGGSAAVHILRR